MPEHNPRYGQIAYEAYSAHTDGRSLVSGDELPAWDEVGEDVQQAWVTAAWAVLGDMFPVRDR